MTRLFDAEARDRLREENRAGLLDDYRAYHARFKEMLAVKTITGRLHACEPICFLEIGHQIDYAPIQPTQRDFDYAELEMRILWAVLLPGAVEWQGGKP